MSEQDENMNTLISEMESSANNSIYHEFPKQAALKIFFKKAVRKMMANVLGLIVHHQNIFNNFVVKFSRKTNEKFIDIQKEISENNKDFSNQLDELKLNISELASQGDQKLQTYNDALQKQLSENFAQASSETQKQIADSLNNYNNQLQEQLAGNNTKFQEQIAKNNAMLTEQFRNILKESEERAAVKQRVFEKRLLESTKQGTIASSGDTHSISENTENSNAVTSSNSVSRSEVQLSSQGSGLEAEDDKYGQIDYFDFENHFRGSEEEIKARQKMYIPYFEGHHPIMDLGSGRGEFLELMKENGIEAFGVDLYEEFVELCKMHGLDARLGDAIETLKSQGKVGGIFAGQIVEHLTMKQVIELCQYAYEHLEDGGCLIMETPNPMCLYIFSNAFYIDPSHQKPVHPLYLQYVAEKAGFSKTEIVFTEASKVPISIPELKVKDSENIDEFNASMKQVENLLFGSRDYALVARK